MELTNRKKRILRAIVEIYISTAEPVGSKAVAEQAGLDISNATIRNEMADLTELGYLEQPHTSAGRIPSPMGYRLYVNELWSAVRCRRRRPRASASPSPGKMSQVDQVMAQAGQMVSSMVGYPAYAMADHTQAVTVQRFDLIAVDDDSFIAVAMLSDSRVKSQLLRWQLPVEREALTEISHLLNTHFTGLWAGGDERPAHEPVGSGVRQVVPAAESGVRIRRTAVEGRCRAGGLSGRHHPAAEIPGVPGRRQGP